MSFTTLLAEPQSKSLKRKFDSLSIILKIKEKIEMTVQQLADTQMDVQRIGGELSLLGKELAVLTQYHSAMETAHEKNASKWMLREKGVQKSTFGTNKQYLAAKLALAQQKVALEQGHVQLLNLGMTMETKEADFYNTEERLKRAKLHISHLQSNIEEAEKEFEKASLGLCEGATEGQELKRIKPDIKNMTIKYKELRDASGAGNDGNFEGLELVEDVEKDLKDSYGEFDRFSTKAL